MSSEIKILIRKVRGRHGFLDQGQDLTTVPCVDQDGLPPLLKAFEEDMNASLATRLFPRCLQLGLDSVDCASFV